MNKNEIINEFMNSNDVNYLNWDNLMKVIWKIQNISNNKIKSVDFSVDGAGYIVWLHNRRGDQNMPQFYLEDYKTEEKYLKNNFLAVVDFIERHNDF